MTSVPAGAAEGSAAATPLERLKAVYDLPVQLTVVLGRASLQIGQLVALGPGSEVELDRRVGEPVDILINNRPVARGRVTVVDDRLGITLTELTQAR